ncbi:glycine cleavage system protein GcvH [Clostridium swellfunianum]|uniref:glycine cleavage system protein GcvH n=1 Tax=Clostridium swellfunianum TaxID=1367462 RepID=UPI00202EE480|nr:glycine cleavage system protein GcvH [Clostridium swellfunianum]MCM0648021.1 glycine cleavage system protein GcvH [Clostridium swellfunianum]
MKVLKDLLYSKEHEWVKVKGKKAYIGITDYAQHALGSIVYVELPEVEAEFSAGEVFGAVESVKAASDMFTPVSGTVLEVNDAVVDDPALVNENAFENWMIIIEMSDKSELEDLLTSEEYEDFCDKEE